MKRWIIGIVLSVCLLSAPCFAANNPFGDGGDDGPSPIELERDRLTKQIEALESQKLLWREGWMKSDVKEDELSKLVVELGRTKALPREQLKRQLNDQAAAKKSNTVLKNLDIGRHQFLKTLFSRALEETNKRLRAKKLTPLDRACILNSGGTGNFTRDIDVTVFAGDDVRETTFFESMRDIAKELGMKINAGEGGSVKKGIELPDLEVAFHRGRNDLPDARFASDPVEFHLAYRRVIEQQAQNPEAYFGYGSDTEVVGRRFLSFKPGQTLVQTFEATGEGIRYTGQIASCMREARAILRGSNETRIRKAQRAIHATNDYLQAYRHEEHGGGSVTQGALKYAGRTLDELCAFHGFKNWMELVKEDRIQLLARMHGPGYLDEPGARQHLEKMAEALDTAYVVYQVKSLPEPLSAKTPEAGEKVALHQHAALAFLRQACASMASSVAQEMLDPPMLDRKLLDEVNRHDHHWQEMNAAERDAYARHTSAVYQQCMSAAAMENLLVMIHQLKLVDTAEFNARKSDNADAAIRQILASADESVRPLLEAAVEHADASIALSRSAAPATRAHAEERMNAARKKLGEHLKKPAPGEEILGIAKGMSPRDFIRMQNLNKPPFWGDALEEMKGRMRKHIEESFPENSYESVKNQVKEHGVKGYLAKRVIEETFQLGNVVDALTLVEMYQGGAAKTDYALFITQNLLGRCYWGLGYLMQAAQVKDEESLKTLGKNVVFDAFSRVIPGLAQAKVFFDIERGLVVVTVGWAINQANADLIDALYTGPAGRLSAVAEGTVGGRIRDSGFCVLDGKFVRKLEDDKTKKSYIAIDQPALYHLYYQKWIQSPAGREVPFDEINTRSPIPGDTGKLLAAHDNFAKAILDIGADIEPAWFGPRQTWADKDRLDKTMKAFAELITPLCRAETDRVLSESAVRQYFQDGRDVIADGLQQRLLSDVLCGMMSVWQTQRQEIQYAKRQIEYMARLGDMKAVSEALAQPITEGAIPKFDLAVDLNLGRRQKTAYTRYGKLPLSCRLTSADSVPPNMKNIGITMEPLEMIVSNKADYRVTTLAMEGVQKVRFIARDNKGEGPILAEKIVEIPVAVAPDAFEIARLADIISLSVSGASDYNETYSGGEPRTGQYNQNYDVYLPYRWAHRKPEGLKITWSGNNFTVDYKEEIAHPYDNDTTRGPVNIKGSVTGTVDPDKRTISFSATQTTVEKESRTTGELSSVKTTVVTLKASNVPVSTFTGMGCDMACFSTSSAKLPGSYQLSGKFTEQTTEYNEEGKVSRESSKSATLIEKPNDGSANANLTISWIKPPFPGEPIATTASPIKVQIKQ